MFESPPEQDRVPDVIGMREDEARAELGAAGFDDVEVNFRTDPDVRAGAGARAGPERRPVRRARQPRSTLVVSEGKPLVPCRT